MAKIVFQKKQYFLGSFERLEDAKAARQEAEELINDEVVAYYERWRAIAERDPEWARLNPVQIEVRHDAHGRLALDVLPKLNRTEKNPA